MLTVFVDRGDKVWQQEVAGSGDVLERIPKCFFEAHAGQMPVDFDRSRFEYSGISAVLSVPLNGFIQAAPNVNRGTIGRLSNYAPAHFLLRFFSRSRTLGTSALSMNSMPSASNAALIAASPLSSQCQTNPPDLKCVRPFRSHDDGFLSEVAAVPPRKPRAARICPPEITSASHLSFKKPRPLSSRAARA